MKNCIQTLLCLILALISGSTFAQTNGQMGIPVYGPNGLTYEWVTRENSKVFGINGSGVLVMTTPSGGGALGSLDDVALSTISSGQLLRYNGTSGDWENWAPDFLTTSAAAAGYQPLDSDLTSIAALSTTSHGRSLLTGANAAASRTTIGAMGTSSPTAFTSFTIDGEGPTLVLQKSVGSVTFNAGDSNSDLVFSSPNSPSGYLLADGSIISGGQIADNSLSPTALTSNTITINGESVALGGSLTISTPGGSSGQVQYNNAGSFGGVTGLTTSTGTLQSINLPVADLFQISYARLKGITFGSSAATATAGISFFNNTLFFHTQSTNYSSILPMQLNLNELGLAASVEVGWSGGNATSSKEVAVGRVASGILRLRGTSATSGAALRMVERTAPASAPPSDTAEIWLEDNGSGKTRLMIRFATGAAQQISIEP